MSNMNQDKAIKVLIDNEKGLSAEGRSKPIAGYDDIGLNSRF